MDYYTNTWIKGFQNPDAATPDMNQIITNPKGIPWCKQWIINEDIPNGSTYILDGRRILDIEGPRKTQQINTYNPDQTIFIQKEWFEIQSSNNKDYMGQNSHWHLVTDLLKLCICKVSNGWCNTIIFLSWAS